MALLTPSVAVMAGDVPSPGKRIAILEFTAIQVDDSYAKALRNKIEVALYDKKLNLIERKHMSRILFEMGNNHLCRDNNCAINQGRMMSAEYVVVGDITLAGDYLITVRIVDVATGRILFAKSASVKEKNDILQESQKVADSLSAMLMITMKGEAEESAVKNDSTRVPAEDVVNLKRPTAILGDLSIQFGYILPIEFLRSKAVNGFALSASGGITVRNFFIGLKTGFIRIYGHERESFSSIIPLMARVDYTFNMANFFISPGLAAGISYNFIHAKDRRVMELMVNPFIHAGYHFTPVFRAFIYADYYCIVEKKRGIQFMTFGAGTGFSF